MARGFSQAVRKAFAITRRLLTVAVLATGFLVSNPVWSQGLYGFMKDAPAGRFDKKDWALLRGAARDALEQEGTSGKVDWTNPETGHSGKITALKAFRSEDGRDCKRLLIESTAGNFSNANRFNLCRHEDGSWREMESGAQLVGPAQ